MGDSDSSVALALGLHRVANEVAAHAVLGQRMGRRRGRRRGVEAEAEIRLKDRFEMRLHLGDVGRHVCAIGGALEPDAMAHFSSTSASTRSGLPLPWRILSGAAKSTAPIGGSLSRLG